MRIISLNTWGGRLYKPLIEFIKSHSKDTDLFCFQEVFKTTSKIKESYGYRTNMYEEISDILPSHQGVFASSLDNYLLGSFQNNFTKFNLSSGLAIFIRKKLKVRQVGDFQIFGQMKSFHPENRNSIPRIAQYLSFINGQGETITICNLHGIWAKEGKNDTPSRLSQSKKIKNFLDSQHGKKILCGDFNLDIHTKSIQMLEEIMDNLIRIYNIKTTRNKFYLWGDKYADFTFVSKEIKVIDFQVPNLEVSDHLPMILEFS